MVILMNFNFRSYIKWIISSLFLDFDHVALFTFEKSIELSDLIRIALIYELSFLSKVSQTNENNRWHIFMIIEWEITREIREFRFL